MTVLCVDDSTDDTLLLQHACRRAGVKFALKAVDDGEKAIDYLTGVDGFSDRGTYPVPRLILLDLKMPTKTGFEVLDWLRLRPEYKSLPVAVFTSSQHQSDIHEAYRKGANCFLTKPVEYESLVQLVKAIDQSVHSSEGLPGELLKLDAFKPQPNGEPGAR
jgi:CheY-like chemotaxis protein